MELLKILVAPHAAPTLAVMAESGLLGEVLGGVPYLAVLDRMVNLEAGSAIRPMRCAGSAQSASRSARMLNVSPSGFASPTPKPSGCSALEAGGAYRRIGGQAAHALLYRLGPQSFSDRALLAWARADAGADDVAWRELATLPQRWTAPEFPLKAADFIRRGVAAGPALGVALRARRRSVDRGGFSGRIATRSTRSPSARRGTRHGRSLNRWRRAHAARAAGAGCPALVRAGAAACPRSPRAAASARPASRCRARRSRCRARPDKKNRNEQVARQSIERMASGEMPFRGGREQHFAAIPECGESDPTLSSGEKPTACGDKRHGNRRQYAAGQHFRQEIKQKARASQPRPAQLPVPYLRGGAAAERLRKRAVDQPDFQAGARERFWLQPHLRRLPRRALRCRRRVRDRRAATAWSCPGRSRSRTCRPDTASAPDRC